ncbi:retroviral-like aspartic protease family protein [Qipengyuania sp. XHP0207]|uniref:retroviral-like aspartic protease family protein n=1 Tax=Qipengyuania sp. XHP0207 TaxID=3038078 RepID=UPI00241FE123|nr:retroviral-like aspartic protease family protein [Qipengyuania sp. XHP0207]MDG5749244.1 retroviral-like aspartic protease family protein [Qipengyuania sp. XHP0207]
MLFRSLISSLAAAGFILTGPLLAQDRSETDEVEGRMPDLPPAQFDEQLSIGGEQIDARKLRSRMTVNVEINGRGPYKFVVDSGADTSAVGSALAGKLALPEGDRALLHGITESKVVDRVWVDELQLGPTVTTDLEVPVLDERHMGGEGMIGLDALVNQRLMMDFEKRVITVDDEVEEGTFKDGIIVVTGRLQRGQLILTEVAANREKVEAVVDTGSEITIGNLALRDKLLRKRIRGFQTIEVTGVTGATMAIEFAVIRNLRLGPITLQNVPIAFADIPPFAVFGLDEKPSLLLGTDLMETFRRVSLDFKDRKVRFQLRKCHNAGVMLRTGTRATRIRTAEESACAR